MKNKANSIKWAFAFVVSAILSCLIVTSISKDKFEVITHGQFNEFVKKTGYITDAEKFGWSIVQKDVFNFYKVAGADWRRPDGINAPKSIDLPVTQISYNDAIAYCKWSGARLVSYDEYWRLIENDEKKVVTDNNGSISEVNKVNILGNVWEITSTENNNGYIRLAGGSLFCSPSTCHGTIKERELYVDKQTANIHIGFAVVH